MHLYVVARGQIDRLRRWENELSSKYFPYMISAGRRDNTNTKWLVPPQYGMLQLAIRPVQLYEIVFPEEALTDVLKIIQPYGGYGISPKMIKFFRKLLKMGKIELKDIPKVEPDMGVLDKDGNFIPPRTFSYRDFVDVMGIGIKEDKKVEVKKPEDL